MIQVKKMARQSASGVPLSSFNAVTEKANQIFVAGMADSLNFNPEFLLCLPTNHFKEKKNMKLYWPCLEALCTH